MSDSFLIGFELGALLTMVAAVLFSVAVAAKLGAPRWLVGVLALILGLGGALSGCGLHLVLGTLKEGPVYYEPEQASKNREAYMRGCLSTALGVPPAEAERWCTCTMERFELSPDHNAIIQANRERGPEDPLPAVTKGFLVEAYLACGPEILERAWLTTCQESCADTGLEPELCQDWCACVHRELLAAHTGEAGARFMLTEVYAGHVMGSEAGDVALDAAFEACFTKLDQADE